MHYCTGSGRWLSLRMAVQGNTHRTAPTTSYICHVVYHVFGLQGANGTAAAAVRCRDVGTVLALVPLFSRAKCRHGVHQMSGWNLLGTW